MTIPIIDSTTFINLADLALNAILMSLYFTISFLFYQGLKYASSDGRLMLRAVSVFFTIAGVRYLVLMCITIAYISSGMPEYESFAPFIYRVLSELALVVAAIYLLYATIKKNPPDSNDKIMEKPKGR